MRRAAMAVTVLAGFGLLVGTAQGLVAQKPTAETLERSAAASLDRLDFPAAADAYRRAAKVRAADDAEAVHDLQMAGLLYANAGRAATAQVTLETAGERALGMGDPEAAAEAFTNAAFVAAERGSERAAILAHRARRLAEMNEVSAGKRALILRRLGPEAVTGALQ